MMKKVKILILISIFLVLASFVNADVFWNQDDNMLCGISNTGYFPNRMITIFNIGDSQNLMISSSSQTNTWAYSWNGTCWVENSSLTNGFVSYSHGSNFAFFKNGVDNIFQVFSDTYTTGYTWNETGWVRNDTVFNGSVGYFSEYSSYSRESFLYLNDSINMIIGNNGNFNGFTWNGTYWNSNSTITEGLSTSNIYNYPTILNISDSQYLFSGNDSDFLTFLLNGTNWTEVHNLTDGLNAGVVYISADVMYLNNKTYLFTGGTGNLYAYELSTYNIPYINSKNPSQSTYSMIIGSQKNFSINVSDYDSSYLTANWYLNGSLELSENMSNISTDWYDSYVFSSNESGSYYLFVNITDSENNSLSTYWNITIPIQESNDTSYVDIWDYQNNLEYLSAPSIFDYSGNIYLISGDYNGGFYSYIFNSSDWIPDYTFINGLSDIGDLSKPNVFYIDSNLYLIASNLNGSYYGYSWSGSSWISNSSIVSGISIDDKMLSSTKFNISDTNNLIFSGSKGLYGYSWSGSSWISNSSIVSGISIDSFGGSVHVFEMNSDIYLLSNSLDGSYYGYSWSGSSWISNSSISLGISSKNIGGLISKFNYSGTDYLIAGSFDGNYYGYSWSGSSWISNLDIKSGLGDISFYSQPTHVNINNTLYVLSGSSTGDFYSYLWNGSDLRPSTNLTVGLINNGIMSSIACFNIDSKIYAITADYKDNIVGYEWNGTSWISSSEIILGIDTFAGYLPSMSSYEYDGDTYFSIRGFFPEGFYTYYWNDSWIEDNTLLFGLNLESAPEIFNYGGIDYLITGNYDGTFEGYQKVGSSWSSSNDIVSGLFDMGDWSKSSIYYNGSDFVLFAGNFFGNVFSFSRTNFYNDYDVSGSMITSGYSSSSVSGIYSLNSSSSYSICTGESCVFNISIPDISSGINYCSDNYLTNNCWYNLVNGTAILPNYYFTQCTQSKIVDNTFFEDCVFYSEVYNYSQLNYYCLNVFGSSCYLGAINYSQDLSGNVSYNASYFHEPNDDLPDSREFWNFISTYITDFFDFAKFFSFNELSSRLYYNNLFTFTTLENPTIGNCYVTTSHNIWFMPTSLISGSGDCIMNLSWRGRSLSDNLSILLYSSSDLSRTEIVRSSGSSGIVYKYNYIDNTSVKNKNLNIFNNILGNKITLVKEGKGIEVQTDTLSDSYDLFGKANVTLSRKILINNIGSDILKLNYSCVGSFCSNVILSLGYSELFPDNSEKIQFLINIPSTVKENDVYYFSFIVSDKDDPDFAVSLPMTIRINDFYYKLSNIFNPQLLFGDGLHITDSIYIPKIIIILLSTVVSFLILSAVYVLSGEILAINILRMILTFATLVATLVFL